VFALLVAVVLTLFSSAEIITRLTTDDRGAAEARGPLNEIAFNMIRAQPITGVGLNNFGVVMDDYVEMDQFGAWLSVVHNAWLLVWSETGLLGMFFYVAFWLAIVWHALRLYLSGHAVYSIIALGIVGSLVAASIQMLVEVMALRTLAQILWTHAALVVVMTRLQKQEARAAESAAVQVPRPLSLPEMASLNGMKRNWNND
jgi:O-antigen ligase